MGQAYFIGVGLGKDVFEVHGPVVDGPVVLWKGLSQLQASRWLSVANVALGFSKNAKCTHFNRLGSRCHLQCKAKRM